MWRIRHEGSPRSIDGLTIEQVVEGLREGQWEPTDEVMGPGDTAWQPLESHPLFVELILDMEPPPPKVHQDETRLDMNPLIDVALVLLIFFILSTTYETLHAALEMARGQKGKVSAQRVSAADVQKSMVVVQARTEGGKTVIRVDGKAVEEPHLTQAIRDKIQATGRKEMLIDAVGVDWGTVIMIQDAGKGALVEKEYFLQNPQEAK